MRERAGVPTLSSNGSAVRIQMMAGTRRIPPFALGAFPKQRDAGRVEVAVAVVTPSRS